MQLARYFDRIGYAGPASPTLEVLKAIHRHHACEITYENIDVVLQRPVDQKPAHIYTKIVEQHRGGWCYEMNGLLGWALEAVGFRVKRVCGAVMREYRGDDALGNHLVLLVTLNEQTWIADVGLGDAFLEPLPLQQGVYEQFGRRYRLESLGVDEWRFHNRPEGMPLSSDFVDDEQTEARLAKTCAALQSDPESMFRQNLICQRMTTTGGAMLLGQVLRDFDPTQPRCLLQSEAELIDVLEGVFAITPPPLSDLWSMIQMRHQMLFGDTPVAEIQFGPPPTEPESGSTGSILQ